MESHNQIIGNMLRMLRKNKGLSQEQLGELSGLHTNYIGAVERGEKNTTLDSLFKIVSALEVDIEYIFKNYSKITRNDSLSNIIQILSTRNEKDHEMILNLLKVIFSWEKHR